VPQNHGGRKPELSDEAHDIAGVILVSISMER
jgi:hypothetical protein